MSPVCFDAQKIATEYKEGSPTPPPDEKLDTKLTSLAEGRDDVGDYRTLVRAAEAGDIDQVQKIFDYMRPLKAAGTLGDIDRLSEIMLEAIDRGDSLLAAYLIAFEIPFGIEHIRIALAHRRRSLVELCLQSGWDINERAPDGFSLLPKVLDDIHLTQWFLDLGADPNLLSTTGVTPLSIAVSRCSPEIVDLLLQYGGDVQLGQVMHFAACREDPQGPAVAKILIRRGVSLHKLMCEDDPVYFRRHRHEGLGTPLHYAANLGTWEMVQLLLRHGADPMQPNTLGKTSIDIANLAERTPIAKLMQTHCKRVGNDTASRHHKITIAHLCN